MDRTVLINANIITPSEQIENGVIIIEGNTILDVGVEGQLPIPNDSAVIDVGNAYIGPGFIDLHIHGALGGDVMDATSRSLDIMAEGLVKYGVTSFMPTTLSASIAKLAKIAQCVQDLPQNNRGAKIIGLHLEGPFLNPRQVGAQNPEYLVSAAPSKYQPLLSDFSCIKRVSAAPEIPGGLELGRTLRNRGIVASIAHSDAVYQEVVDALKSGYTHVTHIYSGMSSIKRVNAYRISGVLEAALLLDELTTEVIADGHHLPPSLIKLVLKTKGVDRVCLVSDSMSATGLGTGQFNLGGLDVVVENAVPEVFEIEAQEDNLVAKLLNREAFASSVATMDRMVRNMVKYVGVSLIDAVRMATINPARMQGVDKMIGSIAPGKKADLVVFDDELNVITTMVDGKLVYKNSHESLDDWHKEGVC